MTKSIPLQIRDVYKKSDFLIARYRARYDDVAISYKSGTTFLRCTVPFSADLIGCRPMAYLKLLHNKLLFEFSNLSLQ